MSVTAIYPNAFVITGTMSSGKTTTVKSIKQETQWRIMRETARTVIFMRSKAGMEDPYTPDLNQEIYDRGISKESKRVGRDSGVIILDRGILDPLAYARTLSQTIEINPDVTHSGRYGGVFVLDPLPFESDGVRPDWEQDIQLQISKTIAEIYREYGYDVVSVPVCSVEERTDFIVARIRNALCNHRHP